MKETIRQHHISLSNALNGLWWSLTTQPNFRIHFLLALVAIIMGLYVGLSPQEWTLLTFTIFWGLSGEMINTAIEAVADLVTTEWRKEAKIAKDVSAGMMLTIAIGTIVIASLLLLPKLFVKLQL